jgi:putative FmdB family regulatory protein
LPTYQYACTACGEHLEVRQSFTDDPLTECPTCEAPLRKVFNAVGVVFKGSGFYKTDSRAKSGTSADSSTPSSEKASTTATSSGAESSGSSSDSSSRDTAGSSPSAA